MSRPGDSPVPEPRPGERHPPVPQRVPPVVLDRPPVRTVPLEYQNAKMQPDVRPRVGLQFLLGFLSPFAYAAIAAALVGLASPPPSAVASVLWLLVAGFVVVVALIRVQTRWTGYIPGVLTATLALPLAALATCAVICSM